MVIVRSFNFKTLLKYPADIAHLLPPPYANIYSPHPVYPFFTYVPISCYLPLTINPFTLYIIISIFVEIYRKRKITNRELTFDFFVKVFTNLFDAFWLRFFLLDFRWDNRSSRCRYTTAEVFVLRA